MSCRFADSFRAGSGWNCSSVLKSSWWWLGELSETCRVSFQKKFANLAHVVGFIIGKTLSVFYVLVTLGRGTLTNWTNNTSSRKRVHTPWPVVYSHRTQPLSFTFSQAFNACERFHVIEDRKFATSRVIANRVTGRGVKVHSKTRRTKVITCNFGGVLLLLTNIKCINS
jgi:hypothetical protein